jgi:hypothetical protein
MVTGRQRSSESWPGKKNVFLARDRENVKMTVLASRPFFFADS